MIAWDIAFLRTNSELWETLTILHELPAPLRDGVTDMDVADIGEIADEPTELSAGITTVHLLPHHDRHVRDTVASAGLSSAMITQIRHLGDAIAADSDGALTPAAEPYLIGLFSPVRSETGAADVRVAHSALIDILPVTGRKVPAFLDGDSDL